MQSRYSSYQRIGFTWALALLSLGQVTQAQERTPFSFPPCTTDPFLDVSSTSSFCPVIQQLAADQITVGCGGGNFCPGNFVSREQMAAFLERAMRGTATWDVTADLLDGINSTQFLRSDTSDSFTVGTLTINAGTTLDINGALDLPAGGITKNGFLFLHNNGTANTALGTSALFSNTTGSSNTANGAQALVLNTTGFSNTASGGAALLNNTSGSYNTANGALALNANTTGNSNTASGAYALLFNTTGFGNAASGANALRGNTTGLRNTASGANALFSNTLGNDNTASGANALRANTTGDSNTASGGYALRYNTTGDSNTASGRRALYYSTTGSRNTAVGALALHYNTIGSRNTAIGDNALYFNTGERNIALGANAGVDSTTGSDNILIGHEGVGAEGTTIRLGTTPTQTRTFIAGINGVTVSGGVTVSILADGQLGTLTSSRRFKEEIAEVGEASEKLLKLRPVSFRYKKEVVGNERPVEFGLIAEEVAESFPELVVYDKEGRPETVKYHLLSVLLLNELQADHGRIAGLEALAREQASLLRALHTELASWRRQQAELTAGSEREPGLPPGR